MFEKVDAKIEEKKKVEDGPSKAETESDIDRPKFWLKKEGQMVKDESFATMLRNSKLMQLGLLSLSEHYF